MATWQIDPSHSEVQFKVKHLVISTVTGYFTNFEGKMEGEAEDFSDAKITFQADVNSISTNSDQRDGHLKSDDFFNAEKFPNITFESTSFSKDGEDYKLSGNLTIRDVTKAVDLNVEFGGIAKDPYGNTKAGFTIEGVVNRKEFGLTWDALTETGGAVVGEKIKLHANVQLAKLEAVTA